jgi:ATPase subunit of ABC transporter with duplicated ATPase domains
MNFATAGGSRTAPLSAPRETAIIRDASRPAPRLFYWMNPRPLPATLVECRDVSFGYGARAILDGVSFTVPRGKVTALMGASGGGKTTVLRLIGGQVGRSAARCCSTAHDVGKSDAAGLYAASAGAWACCSSSAPCSPT